MPSYSLSDFTAAVLQLGRAEVFYASAFGDGTADLDLTHLGVTEEPIEPENNEEFSTLTLPEHTGPAPIEVYYSGAAPEISFTVVDGGQSIFDTVSPHGARGTGYQRRRSVSEKTLVLFPTELFLESNAEVAVAYTTAGGWTVGGDAATTAQEALIDMSLWMWRGFFTQLTPRYAHEEGGKAMREITFRVMQDFNRPDGQQLYTLGDPVDQSIDISPVGG